VRRVLCLLAAGIVLLAEPQPAAAAGPGEGTVRCGPGSEQQPRDVVVRTVPPLRAAGFRLDGRALTGDGRGGYSGAFGCPERLRDRLQLRDVVPVAPGVRQRFARWTTQSRSSELVAVYNVERLVTFRFHRLEGEPVDVRQLEGFALKSSTGQVRRSRSASLWLQSERVITTVTGLKVKKLLYGVESVRVDGTDVVRRGQQRFVPADRPTVPVELLYFPIRVRARDALFGSPTGRAVLLTHPDGRVTRHELDARGEVSLRPLPRGEYALRLEAPAPSVVHPLALSRPQEVDLEVTTWLDLGVLGSSGLAVAAALLVVRRPHLRPRRRAGRAGRRAVQRDVAASCPAGRAPRPLPQLTVAYLRCGDDPGCRTTTLVTTLVTTRAGSLPMSAPESWVWQLPRATPRRSLQQHPGCVGRRSRS